MPKQALNKRKRLILAFFIVVLGAAALFKVGWYFYDYYLKDVDTLAEIVPDSAYFYAHLNFNKRIEPFKSFSQIAENKQFLQIIFEKMEDQFQSYLDSAGLSWTNEVLPQIKNEAALAFLKIDQQNYPLIILHSPDTAAFEQIILDKIRKNGDLEKQKYLETTVKSFQIKSQVISSETLSLQFNDWQKIFYCTVGNEIIISSGNLPIEKVIATYKEKNQSIKTKIPIKYSNKTFNAYWNINSLDTNLFPASWQKYFDILKENKIEEIFLSAGTESDHLNLLVEDKKGILSNVHFGQRAAPDALSYLPSDFQLAILEKNWGEMFQQNMQEILEKKFVKFDINSLSILSSLLPDKELIQNLMNKNGILIIDNKQNYFFAFQFKETIDQSFIKFENFLKKISARHNPSEKEIVFSDSNKAVELLPEIDKVVVSPESALGDNFYSVLVADQKIFYGKNNQFILLGNSMDLLQQSLEQDGGQEKFRTAIQNCQINWLDEIIIWPLDNIIVPFMAEINQTGNVFVAGNNLSDNYFELSGCLF